MDRSITIVGGGLVGSLLATLLARRGHEVQVYERRPDPRGGDAGGGRSINLVLTRRGIRALERAGLADGALALTVPVHGRMMHAVSGELAYQPYGRTTSECNYSIPRGGLNNYLIDAAEAAGVRFRFDMRLDETDIAAGRWTFVSGDGERSEVHSTRLIGTDGAGSIVRQAFDGVSGFSGSVTMLEHGYKELTLPAADDGGFRIERHALHIWPRAAFLLMALPNLGGSFTVTLFMPYHGRNSFAEVGGSPRPFFERQFPDALALLPDLEAEYAANPVGELGTVRCAPWHYRDRVLLLGDAAHAIVPFFGQGMNLGFEDCTVLDELLDAHGDGAWEAVFAETSRRRKPNADAIAAMALDNFVEMRDRVGDEAFLLRKAVEHRLETEIPAEYRSRYSMVMYSHIPFADCRAAGEIQDAMLDELCAGVRDAREVDIGHARRLIGERLRPFLRERSISLDY